MATFEQARTKYYSEEGLETLQTRLKTIYSIWRENPEDKYPIKLQMFGFPPLVLLSKAEAEGHVHELEQILMVSLIDDGG